ncbi:MAG TPA: hypothetical protein DCM05_07845 [Elusimicrobia bacterium]|nr:hypothetical protein [Elusimicrobiota bacterium]
MTHDPDEAEFVESGTFRVDRSRAIRKLKSFGFAEELSPLSLWVRCANASGAGEVRLRQQTCWCEARFDGRPFTSNELHDPFSALLEDGEPRLKHFAQGLLLALREKPKAVVLRSGSGAERISLRARPLGDEVELEVSPAEPSDETDTSVQVEWTVWDKDESREIQIPKERCFHLFAMSRASVALQRDLIVDPSEDPPGDLRVEEEGFRAVLYRSGTPDVPSGHVAFYSYGALVCVSRVMAGRGCCARLDDPGLKLNASLSGVARDERYALVLEILREKAKALTA